jgi:hypothetical protein
MEETGKINGIGIITERTLRTKEMAERLAINESQIRNLLGSVDGKESIDCPIFNKKPVCLNDAIDIINETLALAVQLSEENYTRIHGLFNAMPETNKPK